MKNIFLISLFLSLIFEAVFFSFPFVLFFSIILFLFDSSKKVIFSIFLASILLDILKLNSVGISAIFILGTLLIISIYKQTFETKGLKFITIFSFLSIFLYGKLFLYHLSVPFYLFFFAFIVLIFLSVRKTAISW